MTKFRRRVPSVRPSAAPQGKALPIWEIFAAVGPAAGSSNQFHLTTSASE